MSKHAQIEELKRKVNNLTRMNALLRRIVIGLSRSSKLSAEEEKEDKPMLH